MTFECKLCGNDVEPSQAKQTYDEFGQAMCKTCTEKYLNGENNVRESDENEATTPTETQETPAHSDMEQDVKKCSVEILPPISMDIVRPAVTAQQAAAAWQEFQQLKRAVINKSDLQNIQGKDFIKKSGWRKLAQYFNLTDDIVQEVREPTTDGGWVWTIKVKCIAANGRYTIGVGKCASNERKFAHAEHDTYATAHTRAKNRAISDMIAAGEVSAEEVD
mgnify:CR=1 FL=1